MASLKRRCPSTHSPTVIALAALITILAAAAGAGAEPVTTIPNPRLRDGTWVTDMPGMLRADTVAQLNSTISDLERTNGAEMAVVVIGSLDGVSIEEAAEKLFNLWGIGKKNKDNGLLFLWSTGDRRVRVEVGYGLEGVLPDGKTGAILDTYVIPRFKSGDFDAGVLAGVGALVSVVRNEPIELSAADSESYENAPGIGTILMGLLGAVPVGLGSIFGFRKWRRHRRRRCPSCQSQMACLSETDDDALLEGGQQAEERIGSVDYDVWKCGACSHHFTLRYPKWITSYEKCPQCHHRTKTTKQTTIVAATASSTGSARVVETCAFCTYRAEYTHTIPRITSSSSSSGGSSSSSSSSFGGGSSGGGGASRGY